MKINGASFRETMMAMKRRLARGFTPRSDLVCDFCQARATCTLMTGWTIRVDFCMEHQPEAMIEFSKRAKLGWQVPSPKNYSGLYRELGIEDPAIALDKARSNYLAGRISRDEYRQLLGLPAWPNWVAS